MKLITYWRFIACLFSLGIVCKALALSRFFCMRRCFNVVPALFQRLTTLLTSKQRCMFAGYVHRSYGSSVLYYTLPASSHRFPSFLSSLVVYRPRKIFLSWVITKYLGCKPFSIPRCMLLSFMSDGMDRMGFRGEKYLLNNQKGEKKLALCGPMIIRFDQPTSLD